MSYQQLATESPLEVLTLAWFSESVPQVSLAWAPTGIAETMSALALNEPKPRAQHAASVRSASGRPQRITSKPSRQNQTH